MEIDEEQNGSLNSSTGVMESCSVSYISNVKTSHQGRNETTNQGNLDDVNSSGVKDLINDNCTTFRRENGKNLYKLRKVASKKTWRPNGGKIKPYNSANAQMKTVQAEECIIDVKSVKPKVDTWFKPKMPNTILKEPKKSSKTCKRKESLIECDVNVKSDSQPLLECDSKSENSDIVKNLTSFWNDRLIGNPFALFDSHKSSTTVQKEEDIHLQRSLTSSEESRNLINPEGVIKEHTLLPSKLLAEKNKLTSVKDIISFIGKGHRMEEDTERYSIISSNQSVEHVSMEDNFFELQLQASTETSKSSLVSQQPIESISKINLSTRNSNRKDERTKRFKVLKRLAYEGMKDTCQTLNVGFELRAALLSPMGFQFIRDDPICTRFKSGIPSSANKNTQTTFASMELSSPSKISEVNCNLSPAIYWETFYFFQRGSLEVQPCGVRIFLYGEYKMMALIVFIVVGLIFLSTFE